MNHDGLLQAVYHALSWTTSVILIYFIALHIIYAILFLVSYAALQRHRRQNLIPFSRGFLQSPLTLPVSVLVPAHNEQDVIVQSVRSLLALHYGLFEVVVISDGSTDETLARLKEAFQLRRTPSVGDGALPTERIRGHYRSATHPNLLVIDKVNGGKADALNAGINSAQYPIFCAVDGDSVLEPEALTRVLKPFIRDPRVVAVGGVVRIANGSPIRNGYLADVRLPRHPIALLQIVEYLRAFFTGRMGWSALHSMLIISGAFGVFKKDLVIRCGGYRRDTVGEDMDLVVRMHRRLHEDKTPYRMHFVPDPICWTEAPESFSILRAQRDRWQRGLVESLRPHMRMLMNPRYGAIGMIAMPYFVLFELIGPVIEFLGYVFVVVSFLLGLVDVRSFLLLFAVALLVATIFSVCSILLEEMSLRRYPKISQLITLVACALLENLGFRQWLTWCRCRAVLRSFGRSHGWGRMTRKGFAI